LELISRSENEKTHSDNKIRSAIVLIKNYLTDIRISNETRERLTTIMSLLDGMDIRGINQPQAFSRSPGTGLDTISEAETTDLSMTQSEDDLDLSTRASRSRRSKRAALDAIECQARNGKRRKSGTRQILEVTSNEQVIAQTNVSYGRNGQVHAVSTLETIPNKERNNSEILISSVKPSAPPYAVVASNASATATETESDSSAWQASPPKIYNTHFSSTRQHVESQPPQSREPSPFRFGRTLSSAGTQMRPHVFCQKTVIKPETCEPCGKRIKFSKLAYKCKDCKATCHPQCKDMVPLPCIVTSTPSGGKNEMGCIADYTPQTHPMVPALIQHCVNEIEVRGLQLVGLYRVPGPEKEVKDLKERFLRGKGTPNLARYDVHAICGCVKDFLRSLQEPIVGRWFWRDFAHASEIEDPIKRQAEINRIVQELPPPNQDTLAFVILHLQRIAETPEVKMPIGNLAKVFGPTIVGYSGNDINAQTMLKETKKQQVVLETLLSMHGEFWKKFIYRPTGQDNILYNTRSKKGGTIGKSVLSTPSGGSKSSTFGGHGKKIYFTDDSPREVHFTRGKKKYFD